MNFARAGCSARLGMSPASNPFWWTMPADCGWGRRRALLGGRETNGNAALPAVRALVETPDGRVWAGADDGTLYRCETNRLVPFRAADSLVNQPIVSLHADRWGVIWAGTARGGLLRFNDGRFRRITAKQGLPLDIISQILEDKQGRLWLGTLKGIYCISKSSLNACAYNPTSLVDCVTYGRRDGLPTLECSGGYQPACWCGADGQLWFATTHGVVSVNPEGLITATPPPPVLVEEMRVDGKRIAPSDAEIVVPPGNRQYDFRFTAFNFESGERTRFRYRIDGIDTDWVGAGTRRTAHYGPLPPGRHIFRVTACNDEGVWNTSDATIAFVVQPHFYQTFWFIIPATIGVLGFAVFVARKIAAAKYQRQLARLERQHAVDRDRARIAKDIHDDVGAGLTQITLLTELARREPRQAGSHLERIAGSARRLTKAMDEIVWAVDPKHDTLERLMDYISAYAEDFLHTAGMRCRMDLPMSLPAGRVEAESRHNLFLALKEVLNNVVKHAQATEVWLRLRIGPGAFTLIIEDNGRGFSDPSGDAIAGTRPDRFAPGAGLGNLEKRLTAIGGHCVIHSQPGRGTRVEMTAPLKSAASADLARDSADEI